MVSLLDIVPTILDWYNIKYPSYKLNGAPAELSGKSLLQSSEISRASFGSHNLHEATMYYPMRVVRTQDYKLIHNLNFKMPFPIDQDFFISPTFQDLLNRTVAKIDTHWYKNLTDYYYRSEWELYDLSKDNEERHNLAKNPLFDLKFQELQLLLRKWQLATNDPWICSPSGVLENTGRFKQNPQCLPLYNGL